MTLIIAFSFPPVFPENRHRDKKRPEIPQRDFGAALRGSTRIHAHKKSMRTSFAALTRQNVRLDGQSPFGGGSEAVFRAPFCRAFSRRHLLSERI
ncbi:MAG TPA: hypothetical protein IAA38_09865, partial [Candidatus Ruminococcus gallistercoris]|nr:hypothetical protein [Candidatus Ruminococcus gallistercoris]